MTDENLDITESRNQALKEALALFEGNNEATQLWLSSPVHRLGDKTPNELLNSAVGIEQVRSLIGRLEYGVIT